ncbi:UNVERIFIED_CONTAM: hypothetical protein NCL1_33291 [Trichonephila clavipes]
MLSSIKGLIESKILVTHFYYENRYIKYKQHMVEVRPTAGEALYAHLNRNRISPLHALTSKIWLYIKNHVSNQQFSFVHDPKM